MSATAEVGSPDSSNRGFSADDRCVDRCFAAASDEFLSEGFGMVTTLLAVGDMGVFAWYPSLLWIRNVEMCALIPS
jgi:hypothetical protein